MVRAVLFYATAFLGGAIMTAVPFLVAGHLAHVDEASRNQETMGPGILTAFGLVGAPIGGVVVVLIAVRLRRRKDDP